MSTVINDQVNAMIEALEPEGLKFYATSSGMKLEILRFGFIRYMAEELGVDTANQDEVFPGFCQKGSGGIPELKSPLASELLLPAIYHIVPFMISFATTPDFVP
jgi:hypothetical protein